MAKPLGAVVWVGGLQTCRQVGGAFGWWRRMEKLEQGDAMLSCAGRMADSAMMLRMLGGD